MAKELWFVGPHHLELRERPSGNVPVGHALVRGLFSAVSHGTEALLVTGLGPEPFDPSLDAPGQPTYPRRYGYAWVGEVTSAGEWQGKRVFALQPHGTEHVLAPSQWRPVPDELPAARATLGAAMETALNAVWDAELQLGERVVVMGAGTIGLCVAYAAAAAGAEVVVVEPRLDKHDLVRRVCGVEVVEHADVLGDDFDAVFEVTGNPAVLGDAVERCGFEARVVVVSFYGAKVAPVPLGERFHRRRLRLVSSQVSSVARPVRSRFDYARRFEVVWRLLADDGFDELVKPVGFSDAVGAYMALARGDGPHQVILQY